MSVIKS